MEERIFVKGAKEHNLKNIDISIPKNKLVVITGVSGSGKSSLAFDTIYSEGQRRYVESLSAYARQFIEQMKKPDVEFIEGLSPAISIEQKGTNKNPRSTVGTVTEIYDYMRLLYAHIGKPHCHICGREVSRQTIQEIVDIVVGGAVEGNKIIVFAPVMKEKKGEHKNLFINILKKGFTRARIDGEILYLEEEISLDKNKKHNIDVVMDRLVFSLEDKEFATRFTEAVEAAAGLAEGNIIVNIEGKDNLYSENFACPNCDISLPEVTPRLFSFNAPYGACPECNGLGMRQVVDPNKLVLDENKSLSEGGLYIPGANNAKGWVWQNIASMAEAFGIPLNVPFKDMKNEHKKIIFYGSEGKKFKVQYSGEGFNYSGMKEFEGIVKNVERRFMESASEAVKEEIENQFLTEKECETCHGKKLKPEVLAVTIEKKSIMDASELSINEALDFFSGLKLTDKQEQISKDILKEINERLGFMINVGLDYLTLSRLTKSLSGGEAQRIRLATQIGSGLTGVIYVLDEPSIGLHQRDNEKLLGTLKRLKNLGNTLIVVEHDEETMKEADWLIDMGPGAGINGGMVVSQGIPEFVINDEKSTTGKYLRGEIKIEIPKERRMPKGFITLKGARGHNLKNVNVDIPLGVMTVVTGVSGSGKSSLINETLFPVLFNKLNRGKLYPLPYDSIEGIEKLNKVIDIDQTPIGRTPRSNPATYTKMFDEIRDIFSETKDAKMRGYDKGRFSFNVKGGRCEACQGAGIIKIEMNFLPEVYVECEVCRGKRYNRETLEVYFKGKTIADVLDMSVGEAFEFFKAIPSLERKLKVLTDVGLDYIKLGQAATTLSGGEAQRIKLATELSKISRGDTIYILDEPTTGLHFEDIRKLLEVLSRLVEKGNTVLIIEHNLDVIKTADHIIDVGKEGGAKGGKILVCGTPEVIAKHKTSYTAHYLRKILN